MGQWIRIALALAALSSLSTLGAAETESSAPRRLHIGQCELERDPLASDGPPWFSLCLKGQAGLEASYFAGFAQENVWARYAEGYAGLHVASWLSFHLQGHHRHFMPLQEQGRPENVETVGEFGVMRLGNPALHKFRLTIGRMRLPFGVDWATGTQFHQSFENRLFWASPPHGVAVAFDTQRAFLLEVGAATDRYGPEEERGRTAGIVVEEDAPPPNLEENRAASLRISYDLPDLDGSRLMASAYGEEVGPRRWGLAFVTVSRKGDVTLFEWIRRRSTPDGKDADFQQLLRVGYQGAFRGSTRWSVSIDDERFNYRMGTIGHDVQIVDHLRLKFGVTYYKSEAGDDVRRWIITSGLEAYL